MPKYAVVVKSLLVVVKTRALWAVSALFRCVRKLMCFAHAGIPVVLCCADARTVSCLSGSSSALPAWAYVGTRSHRTPGVLDVLPLAGCGCMRWSRPLGLVICLNTLSRPCHPGGDQACRSQKRPGSAPTGSKACITTVLATRHGSPGVLAHNRATFATCVL